MTPRIPILHLGAPITPRYIEVLRRAIASDGCSGPTLPLYESCCIVHDLGYRYGIDPYGHPIHKSDADRQFRVCMQARSPLGWADPMSWWRWLAVKWEGWHAYAEDLEARPRDFDTYIFT